MTANRSPILPGIRRTGLDRLESGAAPPGIWPGGAALVAGVAVLGRMTGRPGMARRTEWIVHRRRGGDTDMIVTCRDRVDYFSFSRRSVADGPP